MDTGKRIDENDINFYLGYDIYDTILNNNPKSTCSEQLCIYLWNNYNDKHGLNKKEYLKAMYIFMKDYKKLKNASLIFINQWDIEFNKYNLNSEEEKKKKNKWDIYNDDDKRRNRNGYILIVQNLINPNKIFINFYIDIVIDTEK